VRRSEAGEADTAVPPLGAQLEFMRLLWAIDHGLQTRSKRMTVSLGITGPQRLVVSIVGRYPGVSAGQLARILHLDPSTLTGILRRLEQAGLLNRRRDPQDGRRVLLVLSAAGRQLDVMSSGTIEAVMRAILRRVPRRNLEVTREVLGSIAHGLQEELNA
jgi:MarR family transcriptional regulator, organic hydroperoxide resistance regulator